MCSDGPGFFFPYSVFTLFFLRVVFLVKWHKGKLRYISFATLGREIKKKKHTGILSGNIEMSYLPDSKEHFLLISLRRGLGKNRATVKKHAFHFEELK